MRSTIFSALALCSGLLLLSACGGGDSVETLPPDPGSNPVSGYTGPPPQNEDVQQFKLALWDNIWAENRCGSCHGAGGQAPTFARSDNINLAYTDIGGSVNLSSPADSRLVSKVGGGHNCWLASNDACGETMTRWISAWAGEVVPGEGTTIELKDPQIREVGSSKNFPVDPGLFADQLYPLVTEHCAQCHADDAAIAQSPFFASGDIDTAYEAIKSKIDLDQASRSRLVVRLRDEFHNCWQNCSSDAASMEAAILAFSNAIEVTAVDPALVISKAVGLSDGLLASSGGRYENNMIAFYQFKTGSGATAYDTSGVEPALNLSLSGDYEWLAGWGVKFNSGKAQGSTRNSKKLHDMITATGEYSIEAWLVPANVTQEDARIISYSASTTRRNVTLGQTQYNYDFFNRTASSDANGDPALSTPDADEVLQAALQHTVLTFDPVNGRRIYVNGQPIAISDDNIDSLAGWDDSFAFVLANEVSGDRQWQGAIRMLALYNRALTPAQISQNFEVGVGEKFFLLFSIAEQVNLPRTYVVMEVSQYDNYSYLFSRPYLVNLDGASLPTATPLHGMRIGINGKVPAIGQMFGRLQSTLDSETSLSGESPLSELGAVIALEKGAEQDEFFLSFEQLGAFSNVLVEAEPPQPVPPQFAGEQPDIGLRTFAEINASMSRMTGVPSSNSGVDEVYQRVVQQLPAVEDIETFLSSQQMAITQLAIEYCDALIEADSLRTSLFPELDISAAASSELSASHRYVLIDPLLSQMLGSGLASQPDAADVAAELDNLIEHLTQCGDSCSADRTATVAKASCAAVLGSAVMLLQ